MFGADEGHHQCVLPLNNRLWARQARSVHPDKIAVLFLRPHGEHLATALLVELHVPVPGFAGVDSDAEFQKSDA